MRLHKKKTHRLNVILLQLSSANSGFVYFFGKVYLGLKFFFTHGQLFSVNGRLSLFSVKLCSVQKFMIGNDITLSFTQYHGCIKST